MTDTSTPVTFLNRQGQRLFGVLHRPVRPRDATSAILLLSPGVKMRVAPHRLYNKMAAQFVDDGFTVFRFDFHGLGDSEGEAPDALLADLYGATQVGRYVDDTLAAMDWLQATYGHTRFIAAGLCGGALTGLLAAARDTRINSLLALSIPVILDGRGIDAAAHMTEAQLTSIRGSYLERLKLWDADARSSWKRFFSLQSDYSLIRRSIVTPLKARLRRAPSSAPGKEPPISDNTNPHFAPAFHAMMSTSRRVLLLFAEADRLYWEFEEKFMSRHRATLEPYASHFQIHVTPHANHVFAFEAWQRDMLDHCSRWLLQGDSRRSADASLQRSATRD